MLLLPLDEYSRRTYVSENALLPGQVHTYFHGSEQNIFRAYRHEVANVLEPKSVDDEQGQPTGQYLMATEAHRNERLEGILQNAGLKTARQAYSYESGGKTYTGENIYAIVHGPRADGTESIVLMAPIRNIEDKINTNGVTLLLTLARYFSRWSLWSKDIIILITPDTAAGPRAWVDAYHSTHDPAHAADLSLKSGHIQGVLAIDYPFEHRFETLHVAYDGINGQLPNLDLINTAIQIASGQMGIGTTIQSQHTYTSPEDQSKYRIRLKTLFRGMGSQALGHSTGAHSVFMPYHIDAITLTAVGHGWQDEMAFGRSIESVTRSLNNLLEKLHQSFFFYLLLQNTRFVSIGTYLPSAMAIGAGFTIVAIFRWIMGGYEEIDETEVVVSAEKLGDKSTQVQPEKSTNTTDLQEKSANTTTSTKQQWKAVDRPLALPITIIAAVHLCSISTLFLPTQIIGTSSFSTFTTRSSILLLLLASITILLGNTRSTTSSLQQLYSIISSLSLLILGLELTVLATLNFSLSMFLGVVCSPLAFVSYITPSTATSTSSPSSSSKSSPLASLQKILSLLVLMVLSPPVLIFIVATIDIYYVSPFRAPIGVVGRVREYLDTEAFAFDIWGSWGSLLGVWGIWGPAWIVGMTAVVRSFIPVNGNVSAARNKSVKK